LPSPLVGVFVYFLFSLLWILAVLAAEGDTAAIDLVWCWGQVGSLPFSILSSLSWCVMVARAARLLFTGETIAPRQAF